MQEPKKLILSADLVEFFRGEVLQARDVLGVRMNDVLEYYLVHLLCDFSRHATGRVPTQEPLAFMYKKATESSAAEQVHHYKDLGDVALYVAGFFGDFVAHSLVDVDYYISMGGSAYSSLAALVGSQRHGESFAQLYGQLAVRFTELVDVLNEIAERSRLHIPQCDQDLLKLYDRYARTGSLRLRRQLLERGLLPNTALPTGYVQ